MKFEHMGYLPWILMAFSVLLITTIWLERKFFKLVKLYWFYNRSIFSYISSLLFCVGMGMLLFSLLDLRGPEEKIKSGVPTERTILLIDTSASMLAEDVKPSRLQKAVLIAKHFARKAVGQQLSIVAFAEIQKKIVPFTNDLDLLDARLDSIKNLRNQNGSSALTAAIQESIQYFKETGEARGNILVLTDGEETANDINLNIPKEFNVALVGVGTKQGGRIPLDDGRGFRFGYKKYKGKDVITTLDEGFFKKVVADIPSGEYWIANTYSLPSDDILEFFKGEMAKSEKQQDMVIKPVMMEWIVIPAIVLLILSYFFKALRVFSLGMFLLILPLQAQEEKPVEIPPAVQKKMELLQKGELTQLEKLKLADQLQRAGAASEAMALYEENLPIDRIDPNLPPEAYLNYGTGLLEKGEEQKGLAVYDTLNQSLEGKSDSNKLKEMLEKNVVNYFKVQEQKKEQQKKDQQNKDNKENKENKDQKDGQNNESGNNQKDSKQGQQGQQKDQKDQNGKPEDKKDQKGDKGEEKDKSDKKDEGEGKEGEEKDKPKDGEESDDGPKKPMPPKKVSPKLQQLMSDDRQLQMKIIEQGTRDMNRRKNRENKDW